ncbi:MAG: TAXI family TRAP transporter solute-binding subunit [Dehalococcoidia bacterium]|nr:TAXI family TRAP transporter solute-binding subunit [Dehalococcoidia bacterium]
MKRKQFAIVLSSTFLAAAVILSSCGKPTTTTLHFAATGSSGEMKVLSWATIMQADLADTIIRVVNEPAWTNAYKDMAQSQMALCQIDKSTMRDCIEAINEYASSDGGPWLAGLVWIDSLAATGFMVRGNSDIYKPEDIKPGTRIAIWNDKSATLSPFRSLLAWAGVDEKDIVWVNTGDYDACPRAVADGRADICMAAPVSPAVLEASNAPGGVRYISLNPADNPTGAAAFLEISPLYNFGPITVGPKSVIGTWGIISYKYLGSNLATDADLIYQLVKWLDENYDKYCNAYESNAQMTLNDLLEVMETTYLPLHPGLIKYLKEKGIWKADYERRNEVNTILLQRYIDSYQDAMREAAAQGVDIKPNNDRWIEFWENYKAAHQIPIIQMHVNLTQDATPIMPPGYVPPGTTAGL